MYWQYWKAVLKHAAFQIDESSKKLSVLYALVVLLVISSPTILDAILAINVPLTAKIGPPVLYLLAIAPYVVWKREHDRAEAAEARFRPALTLSAVVRSFDSGVRKIASIRVVKSGLESVQDCTAYLRAVEVWRDGALQERSIAPAGYLRWSAGDGGGRTNSFAVEGFVDVIELKHPYEGRSFLAWAGDITHQNDRALPEENRYVLDIGLGGQNIAAHDIRCEYTVTERNLFAPRNGLGGRKASRLPEISFRLIPSG